MTGQPETGQLETGQLETGQLEQPPQALSLSKTVGAALINTLTSTLTN